MILGFRVVFTMFLSPRTPMPTKKVIFVRL